MDLKQEDITTLHDLCVDQQRLLNSICEITAERPVSIVMPMLYSEIHNNALGNILKELNKCTYLKEVVIPLAAKNRLT
jgi:glucosyl-3-phosphoglycerate synthase